MEEEAKKPKLAMYEVPDVKAKMNKIAPTAKWMEARGKLQNQLDTLITKTSEKMAKYGSIHARVKDDFVKDSSIESDGAGSMSSQPGTPKEVVDKQVKTLIKTVANEIQKSFSKKSIHALDDEEEKEESESEESEDETEEERERREEAMRRREEERRKREERENARKAKRVIKEAKKRQKHIDVEAPILDFELKEPTPEPEPESEDEEDNKEAPIDFNAPAAAINLSAARSKIDAGRAKKRAAERAKGPKQVDASTCTDSAFTEIEMIVAEKLYRKEKFSDKVMQTQWEISNAEYEFSRLSDNEKAEMLTKQISKMKSKHVTNLLKSIDTGVLDISVPMLVPFLSLQARMSLGTDLHKNRFMREDAAGKNKMAKETFVDTMLKDITDIALLQEVIERSQEKLQILAAEDEKRFAEKMRKQMVNIENDSFELGSSQPLRGASPIIEKKSTPLRSVTPAAETKEISTEIQDGLKSAKEESEEGSTSAVANKNPPVRKSASGKEGEDHVPFGISDVLSDEEEEVGDGEVKKEKSEDKNSHDEGCGSSESDDDKDETKKVESKAEESDEGIGKSDDNASKDEEESKAEEEPPKENNIKNKILNIIQDAKAMDQKRSIRNYGRNFEFQGMKEVAKPVLPNDRRPTKAKRLDSMWMNVTAAKQRFNDPPAPSLEELKSRQKKSVPTLEELKNKPKSNVPWTRKNNAQPLKKEILAEEKEVKEFDSCRKPLKDNVKVEAGVKDTREIQSVKKKETSPQCAPVVNEKEASKACEEEKTEGDEEKEEVNVVEIVESKKKSPEKVADSDTAEKTSCNDENAKREAEEAEVKVGESECKVNASEPETATLPERSLMSPSNASESSSEVEWEMSEEEEEVLPSKPISPIKERSPVREKSSAKPEHVIATKEIPSLLLMSPAVRRRGETSSSNFVRVGKHQVAATTFSPTSS